MQTSERFSEHILPLCPGLFELAAALLRDTQAAEDVLQEVLLTLWEKRDTLDAVESLPAFTRQAVRNRCLDRLRSYRSRNRDARPAEEHLEQLPPEETPETELLQAEARAAVMDCIAALPPVPQQLIRMREIGQLSYEEMQTATGMSPQALRVALSRARKRVQHCYLQKMKS